MGKAKQSLEDITKEMLVDFGMPTHLKGYQYLCVAIATAAKKRNVLNVKVKDLYTQLAETYADTVSNVEAAIRQAIDETWVLDDTGTLAMYFGYGNDTETRPENEAFIIFVADRVQMIRRCQ